jgi:hypothetical protein
MREELRDCPLGEIPMLAPEVISVLRHTAWPRGQFGVRAVGGTRNDVRSYADKIHDATFDAVSALDGVLVPVRAKAQTPPAA